MINKLVTLFSEPSTYAGFSGIALAFGMSDSAWTQASAVAASVFGVAAVVLRERAPTA